MDMPKSNNWRRRTPPATTMPAAASPPQPGRPLSAAGEIEAAIQHLRDADPLLLPLLTAHRRPSFADATTTTHFHSLARSILYHNLSFPASTASYSRLLSLLGCPDRFLPGDVLALTPDQLRRAGVSGRKAADLRALAAMFLDGAVSDASLAAMDDASLFSLLSAAVRGVGVWSAHMFMIFALHRPDVLPTSDLGLRKGVQLLYGLVELPEPSEMERLCERWRPYRTVGAWYMWRLAETKEAASP